MPEMADDFVPKLQPLETVVANLGLGKSTVYKLIKAGELRSIRVFRRRLIYVDSYVEFLKRRDAEGSDLK